MHLSDKISLNYPRLRPTEDICIGIYVLKRLLSVRHILEKAVSMQHSFEEFSEKQRRVEFKSVGNRVANLGFSLFRHFFASLFNFLNYFVWLRITDEGSVPEMRICPYC